VLGVLGSISLGEVGCNGKGMGGFEDIFRVDKTSKVSQDLLVVILVLVNVALGKGLEAV